MLFELKRNDKKVFSANIPVLPIIVCGTVIGCLVKAWNADTGVPEIEVNERIEQAKRLGQIEGANMIMDMLSEKLPANNEAFQMYIDTHLDEVNEFIHQLNPTLNMV